MGEHRFILIGDNISETKDVAENIIRFLGPNSNLKLIRDVKKRGYPPLTIYEFLFGDKRIILKCYGSYSKKVNDFPKIKEYITYFDKPDVVLYYENENKIVAAGEFTETVSVGNSQWQRSQRFVSAAKMNIPFLGVYAFGEDRSQKTLRESSALLTYAYLKLTPNKESPLFIILKNSLYLHVHNKLRIKRGLIELIQPQGEEIIGKWFGLRLLNSIENIRELELLELDMIKFMLNNLYYEIKVRKEKIPLVKKDLPKFLEILGKEEDIEKIRKTDFKSFCVYGWNISGKELNKSYFKRDVYPKIKDFYKTYNPSGKFAIADKKYTKKIEDILIKFYPPNEKQSWSNGFLDSEKPIVIIPLQVWKKMKRGRGICYSYNDPNGGEAVLFPSLLDSLDFNSTANIVYIFYGECPFNWHPILNKNKQKIFRAVNTIGKLLCVDNNGNKIGPESLKIIRRIPKNLIDSTLIIRKENNNLSEDDVDMCVREYLNSKKGWKIAFYSPPAGSWSTIKFELNGKNYESFSPRDIKRPDIILYKIINGRLHLILIESKESVYKFSEDILKKYKKTMKRFAEKLLKHKYRIMTDGKRVYENVRIPINFTKTAKIYLGFLAATSKIKDDAIIMRSILPKDCFGLIVESLPNKLKCKITSIKDNTEQFNQNKTFEYSY